MNNEPVAWIDNDELWNLKFKGSAVAYLSPTETKLTKIPLYTHPVKELTDAEIYDVWFKYGCGMPWTANTKTFIRAILRKAQEK